METKVHLSPRNTKPYYWIVIDGNTEVSQKAGRSLGGKKNTVNPSSKFYMIMLVNEDEAVRRCNFRINKPRSYSGNTGENYNRNHHFSSSSNNLDIPLGIHSTTPCPKLVQMQ